MKKYELMYIVNPTLDPESLKGLVSDLSNVITNNGGNIVQVKEAALKDLAYEIEKHRKGFYVWLLAEMTPEIIAEYKRVISITEAVIRHIEVKEGE